MSMIVSETTLLKMPADWWPTATGGGSLSLYNGFFSDYATLWQVQPNVRTCVDFLARNIAQLGIHMFKFDETKGRVRLRDHPMAALLGRPLPNQMKFTRYRMIEAVMSDLGIFGNAFLKKEINADGKLVGLLRLPPTMVSINGSLVPVRYDVNLGRDIKQYEPDEVVHFRMYDSKSAVKGLSPLETLRRVLAEEHASGKYREHYWENAARMSGVITRPEGVKEWSPEARQRFKAEWQELYSGPDNSGKTAILEEGMEWHQMSFNPKESEYLAGRKLTREECARAYHIPPPLVGILDHATYSNIESQHKSLYTDVLGPWLAMMEEDLQMQLLSDFEDTEGVYLEFNIQEKLQGDFEAQMKSLQSATGRPWLLVNEARDIMNLPKLEGGDELSVPMNITVGDQIWEAPKGAGDVATKTETGRTGADQVKQAMESFDAEAPGLREVFDERWRALLVRTFERQRAAILPAIKSDSIETVWDAARWNTELTADFGPLSLDTALAWAQAMGKKLGVVVTDAELAGFVSENARIAAEYLNESTQAQVEAALAADDPKTAVRQVFETLLAVAVVRFAISRVTTLSNYGAYQAAVRGRITTKTWVVNSTNPRDSHAAMNGETVGIRDRFSNGLRWPGDYAGGAEQTVNCQCSLRYNRDRE